MHVPVSPPGRSGIHHDTMIVLRVRSSALEIAHVLDSPSDRKAQHAMPGLSMLESYRVAGRITSIVHVHPGKGSRRQPRTLRGAVEAAAAARGRHAAITGTLMVEAKSVRIANRLLRALANDPHVVYAARVPVRYAVPMIAGAPTKQVKGPPFPPLRTWHIEKIGGDPGPPNGPNARRVKVAVLDTGVDMQHPALRGRIARYVHRHADLGTSSTARDVMGHGTHVCGIIAARNEPRSGARGVCNCRIHVWKVFDDAPDFVPPLDAFYYAVNPILFRRALAACIEEEMDVVNLSLGGTGAMDPHETALIQGLLDRGTTIVAAMGNFRQRGSPTQWPGAYPGVVAVGATDPTDTVAPFSSRGKHIALCAPGVSIWSTLPTYDGQFGFLARHARGGRPEPGQAVRRNNDADSWLGTSMATPHVTAAAALLREKMPHLSGAQVRQRLMRTADRVPGMRGQPFTLDYGAGRLNVRRLLAK